MLHRHATLHESGGKGMAKLMREHMLEADLLGGRQEDGSQNKPNH
jgi:hypothetical protein